MKKGIIWVLFGTLIFSVFSNQSVFAQQSSSENEELSKLIAQLTERYNKHRIKTSEIYKRYGFDSKQMLKNEQFIANTDAQNLKEAKKILERFGFPTHSMVGAEKAHEYWVVVQACDADIEFQLLALKKMDKLLAKEEANNRDFAYLSDRVRVNLGLKQEYGTQVRYNEQTKSYEPFELNKPEDVDKRRNEMELEPIATYLKSMNAKYAGSLKRNKNSRRLKKKR